MVSGPAGFSGRLLFGSALRRAFRALGCLWLLPRQDVGSQRLSRRYPSRLTATERRLWVPRIQRSRPLRSLPPPLRPIWTPSALLPNYTLAIGRENNAQSLRATSPSNTSFSAGHWPCPPKSQRVFPHLSPPPFSEIQEFAGKGRLHTTDEDIALLVRNPTPAHYSLRPAGRAACLLGDEPIRIYVPLLMRSGIIQARHSTASCRLGTARTLRIFERFYWWIEMSTFTRWWLRHCLKCQVRKAPRLTFRWPVISIPLPPGPGIAVSVDFWAIAGHAPGYHLYFAFHRPL